MVKMITSEVSELSLLDLTIPSNKLPIREAGIYTFAISDLVPGTLDSISQIAFNCLFL